MAIRRFLIASIVMALASGCSVTSTSTAQGPLATLPRGTATRSIRLEFRPVIAILPPDYNRSDGVVEGSIWVEGSVPRFDPPGSPPSGGAMSVVTTQLAPDGTIAEEFDPGGTVVVKYALGPVAVTQDAIESARARVSQVGTWVVAVVFKKGGGGIDLFNTIAGQCFEKSVRCPSGQLAILVDGRAVAAPSINSATFARDEIEITGVFDQAQAEALAAGLRT